VITIGEILRPHGTKGEVKIMPMTDFPERFRHLRKVTVADSRGDEVVMEVERARVTERGVILKFKGIDTVQEAEGLRRMFLVVTPSETFPLPEGRHYVFDIIGLDVITDVGTKVGKVGDVMKLKSSDVYVVRSEKGDVLIPATKEIVKQIDVKKGRILIHPVKGLLD